MAQPTRTARLARGALKWVAGLALLVLQPAVGVGAHSLQSLPGAVLLWWFAVAGVAWRWSWFPWPALFSVRRWAAAAGFFAAVVLLVPLMNALLLWLGWVRHGGAPSGFLAERHFWFPSIFAPPALVWALSALGLIVLAALWRGWGGFRGFWTRFARPTPSTFALAAFALLYILWPSLQRGCEGRYSKPIPAASDTVALTAFMQDVTAGRIKIIPPPPRCMRFAALRVVGRSLPGPGYLGISEEPGRAWEAESTVWFTGYRFATSNSPRWLRQFILGGVLPAGQALVALLIWARALELLLGLLARLFGRRVDGAQGVGRLEPLGAAASGAVTAAGAARAARRGRKRAAPGCRGGPPGPRCAAPCGPVPPSR
ncbi:hypothetical protein IIA16_05190, partial [bacterium]|nr:hypothetical protein [bacterium]